ncbi:MAG: sugar ABC transporter permease [Lentisphaerota bacterium]
MNKLFKNLQSARKNYIFYLFIFPAVFYLILFVMYPLIHGFVISFQKYGLLGFKKFVWLDNYLKLFGDIYFYQTIGNTLIMTAGIVLISVTIPIIFAVAIDKVLVERIKKTIQTTLYVPYLLSSLIIVGIFVNLLSPTGPFNTLLQKTGLINESIPFFTNGVLSQIMLIIMTGWKDIGYNTLIYLAALTAVNPALYEAASIDGANIFQKTIHITIPGISGTIKIVFLMTLMGAMRTFDMSYVVLNSANYKAATTAIVYTYEQGILKFDMGLASAAAGIIFFLSLFLMFVVKKLIRY